MSDSNREAHHELTRQRGEELDRWWAFNFMRYMKFLDPISPTLSDMPTEILNQVLNKLEPIDQLRTRKVCRNLRTSVDEFRIHFDEIHFFLWEQFFTLKMDGIDVRYYNLDNNRSIVQYAGQKKVIKGASSMKLALQDLKSVLKHTMELRIYNKSFEYETFTYFIDILKSMKYIHVRRIILLDFSFNDVVTILQYFDSKVLKHIILWDTHQINQFKNITCLDQWKCAKKFHLMHSILENTQIVHLFHFHSFRIKLDDFPTQIAISIRDDLMKRSTFQGCDIECENLNSNIIEIAKVFKPDYEGGSDFSIKYSTENANFEIKCALYDDFFTFSVDFCLKFI